jgi:hypothetical protein
MNLLTKLSCISAGAAFIAVGIVGSIEQVQAYTLFDNSTAFQSQLDTLIIDDYSNPGYPRGERTVILSNTRMSSVFGETQYLSTGFDNLNYIININNGAYCAGCIGSFLLNFTQTSVGTTLGVFGAGFNILNDTDYFAHVTFGDNSTQDFSLVGKTFFGMTSELNIKSFNIGLPGGQAATSSRIVIDNLTIGSSCGSI